MAYKRNANNILVFTVIEYIGVVLTALKLWPVYKTHFFISQLVLLTCVFYFSNLYLLLSQCTWYCIFINIMTPSDFQTLGHFKGFSSKNFSNILFEN